MPDSTISVVIPALNEAANLAELLPQIVAQTKSPTSIIVADAGSTDGGAEAAAKLGAEVIPGGRPAAGRNAGAAAAQGDWLFFIDADTRLPDNDFFGRVLDELEAGRLIAGVTDCQPYYRPGDKGYDRPLLQRWDRIMIAIQNSGCRSWHKRGFPVGLAVFMACRRREFLDLGGFNSAAEPYEDSELLLRLHRRLPAATGAGSSVGVVDPALKVLISMRRYDVRGRVWFPLVMGLRGSLGRWAMGRELPQPDYWDVNDSGFDRRPR